MVKKTGGEKTGGETMSLSIDDLEKSVATWKRKVAEHGAALTGMKERLAALPPRLVEAKPGPDHDALLAEYRELDTRIRMTEASIDWLRTEQRKAIDALYSAMLAQVQSEIDSFYNGEYRAALDAREAAILALQRAQNNNAAPATARERDRANLELVELRVERERAVSRVAFEVAPKLDDLKRQREALQAEYKEALARL